MSSSVDGQPQLRNDIFQQLPVCGACVENEGCVHFLVQVVQEPVEKRRLAGAHFAGERHEAFPLLDAVHERSKRLAVSRRKVEKPGVGGYVERIFRETVVLGVHGFLDKREDSCAIVPGCFARKIVLGLGRSLTLGSVATI